MTLPFSRTTTYVAGVSEVKSDDLNTMQDSIGAGGHGDMFKTISRWLPYTFDSAPDGLNLITGEFDGSAGSGSLSMDLDLSEGDRLKTAAVYILGDAADDHNLSAWIISHNPTTAPLQLGSTVVSTNTPAAQTLLSLSFTAQLIAASKGIVVLLEGLAAGSYAGPLRISWDRPLP